MAESQTVCAKKSDFSVVGGNTLNKIKWLTVLVLLAVAAVGFQYFAELHLGIRIAGLVALVGAAIGIACTTSQGRDALEFISSAKAEARKVVWPTRKETIQSTIAVVVMVLVASVFLWLLDSLLLYVMSLITA
ncbi:MAG: preprotein translocase subunit SecE [Gammaproteobacteria bacterium]